MCAFSLAIKYDTLNLYTTRYQLWFLFIQLIMPLDCHYISIIFSLLLFNYFMTSFNYIAIHEIMLPYKFVKP